MATGGDERDRQLASSPPPSWEDRAELMPEEQPFGVSWMETGTRHVLLTHSIHTDKWAFTNFATKKVSNVLFLGMLCR